MSSNHLTEENHAVDETSRTQPPPSAAGDRAPGKKRSLIAQDERPSFLELLAALWDAEKRLEKQDADQNSKPSTEDPEEKESVP